MLAYYQTQQAKQRIEQRLDVQGSTHTGSAGAIKEKPKPENVITLQLPETSDAQQRYILTLEQLAIKPVNTNELPVNNEALDSETSDTEDEQPQSVFDRIAQHL